MANDNLELTLYSEEDTKHLAVCLADMNLSGSIWLSGDLGAGKTTLTRYWLQALGHMGAVKSPTYTLVEPYDIASANEGSKTVYHVDLYRLQDPEELDFIGFDDYQDDDDALLIIEWASRAKDYLAPPILEIHLTQSQADIYSRDVRIQLTQQGVNDGVSLVGLSKLS